MPGPQDEEWEHPPRPLDSPKFCEWAVQFIFAAITEDPWAGELTVDDIRDMFDPDEDG
jgi:hypothetical protein